jgi:hypothetical protein
VLRDDGLALQRYRFRDSATVLEDEWTFAWAEVDTIYADKVGTFVVDQIRLLFNELKPPEPPEPPESPKQI